MQSLQLKFFDQANNTIGTFKVPLIDILQFVVQASNSELQRIIRVMSVNAAELKAPDVEGYISQLAELQSRAKLSSDTLVKGRDFIGTIITHDTFR